MDLAALLRQADWLQGLARTLVKDGNEAEDVWQEALEVARTKLTGGGSDSGLATSRPWLAGVVRNVARSRARRDRERTARETRGAQERLAQGQWSPSPEEDLGLVERQRQLLEHIGALPPAQRRVILARFYEGLPPREIAAQTGVPVATVKTQIQRGLDALRVRLDSEYGDRRAWATLLVPIASPWASIGGSVGAKATAFGFGLSWIAWAVAALLVGAVVLIQTKDRPPALDPAEFVDVGSAHGKAQGQREPLPPPPESTGSQGSSTSERVPGVAPNETPVATPPRIVNAQDRLPSPGPGATAELVLRAVQQGSSLPAPDVYANLFPRDNQTLVRERRKQRTDRDGFARWTGLQPGRYRVLERNIEVHGSGITDITVEIPWGPAIRGIVIDMEGTPVPNAWVSEATGARTQSDDQGRFALHGAPNMAWVSAKAEGFQRSTVDVISANEWSERSLELRMAPGGPSISGRVLAPDGALVAGITVRAKELERYDAPGGLDYNISGASCVSDAAGHYQLDGLLPVPHRITIRATGFPRYEQTVQVAPGAQVTIDIQLPEATTIFGKVTDAKGTPIPGADVAAYGSSRDASATTTDEHGNYRIENPPAGVSNMRAQHGQADMAHKHVQLKEGEPHRVDFTLPADPGEPASGITFQFVDEEGRPLEGWHVTAFSEEAEHRSSFTDEQGRVRLNHAKPWMQHFSVGPPGFYGRPVQTFRDIAQSETPVTLTVTNRTCTIRGRVTDTAGGLPGDADLHLSRINGVYKKLQPSGPDGTFEWVGVPSGLYEIRFQATGRATRIIPVNLTAGETLDLGELISSTGGFVELDLEGFPVQRIDGREVPVYVMAGTRRGFAWSPLPVDPTTSRIGPLPHGNASLTVLAHGCALTHIDVDVRTGETTQASVSLEEGYAAPLHLTVGGRSPDSNGAGGIMVSYEIDNLDTGAYVGSFGGAAQSTSYELTPLAPGRYRVRAADTEGRVGETTVVVPEGGARPSNPPELRLEPPPGS